MKYNDPELQMRLAAEYVLGTLRGPARTRFEHMLANNPGLRAHAAAWEQRLGPWGMAIRPVPVPPAVWLGVQRRLGLDTPNAEMTAAPVRQPGTRQWWQWWAWGSTALAAMLAAVLLLRPAPAPAPVFTDFAVLASDTKEPGWIVRVDTSRKSLALSSLKTVALPAGKALELWSIPAHGAPMSLGVLPLQHGHAVLALNTLRQQRLGQATLLAISLEPSGGSPTGLPTGPVLYTGTPANT